MRKKVSHTQRLAEQTEAALEACVTIIQTITRAKFARVQLEVMRYEVVRCKRLQEIHRRLLRIRLQMELRRWIQKRRLEKCEAQVEVASAKCRYVQSFLSRLLSTGSEDSESDRAATVGCKRKAPRLNRSTVKAVLSESLQELHRCRQLTRRVRIRNFPAR